MHDRPSPRIALPALATAQFMVVLDSSVVNVALPSIRDDLHLVGSQPAWVVNGYLVAFGGLLMLGGRLSDVLRARAVFLGGMALFLVTSVACTVAPNGPLLITARVVHGVGAAVLAPAALAIVMRLFPSGPERGRAMGVWGAVSGAGGIAGVLFGGVLSQSAGWPWIFLVNVPIGVLATIAVLSSVAPVPAGAGRLDGPGAVTSAVGLAALAYGLVSGSAVGWASPRTLIAFVVAVVGLGLFVLAERRAQQPLVSPSIVRRGRPVTANAIMLVLGGVTVGLFYFLPQYQQAVLGMSPVRTSLTQVPMAVMISLTGLYAPRLAERIGTGKGLVGGLAVLVAGLLWLSPASAGASYLTDLLGPLLLIGAGIGITTVYVTTLAVSDARDGETGLMSGLVNTTRQIGGALGLAGLVAVSSLGGEQHTYTWAFLGAAALAVVAIGLSLLPVTVSPGGDPS